MKQSRCQGQEMSFATLFAGTNPKICGMTFKLQRIIQLIFGKTHGQDYFAELQNNEVLLMIDNGVIFWRRVITEK